MNATQRYAMYKNSYRDNADPLQSHINNLNRAIKHFGGELVGSYGGSSIDSYILTMIETNDQRRALLDLQEIPKAAKALEADLVKIVKSDIKTIVNDINKSL